MQLDIIIRGARDFRIHVWDTVFHIEEERPVISSRLPDPAPDEWDFRVGRHTFRLRLRYLDTEEIDMIKELASERWKLRVGPADGYGVWTITATYTGLYLPSAAAFLVHACTPAPPLASSQLIDEALQPHILDAILRWAIKEPIDACRAALVGSVWAHGVEACMLSPQLVRVSEYGDPRSWTGLPAAVSAPRLIKTPEDAAALATLSRAVRRPAAPAQQHLTELFSVRDAKGWGDGLHFYVFRFEGLPNTTFLWCHYWTSVDCCVSDCSSMLYLLEGSDPTFRLVFSQMHGEESRDSRPQLHLPRFLALRARLRAVFPRLACVSDPMLLGLLAHISDSDCSSGGEYVASICAFTRLMPGHPERGDEEAQWDLYSIYEKGEDATPVALGADGNDDVELTDQLGRGWLKVRGVCVLNIYYPIDFSVVGEAIELIDAFHRRGV